MEVFEDVVFRVDAASFFGAVRFEKAAVFEGRVWFGSAVEIKDRFYAPRCERFPTSITLKVNDTWYEPKAFLSVRLGSIECTVYDTNLLHVDCNLLSEVLPYDKAMPKLRGVGKEATELVRFTKNILLLRRRRSQK